MEHIINTLHEIDFVRRKTIRDLLKVRTDKSIENFVREFGTMDVDKAIEYYKRMYTMLKAMIEVMDQSAVEGLPEENPFFKATKKAIENFKSEDFIIHYRGIIVGLVDYTEDALKNLSQSSEDQNKEELSNLFADDKTVVKESKDVSANTHQYKELPERIKDFIRREETHPRFRSNGVNSS